MEASECPFRRISQVARHLSGSFGIQSQACKGTRKDGRVLFARQTTDNHGQFMRQFQSKQTKQVPSVGESESCGAMHLTASGAGTIENKWGPSSSKGPKSITESGSGPIFAKAAPVSGAQSKVETVGNQVSGLPELAKKAPTTGPLQDHKSDDSQGLPCKSDLESEIEGARKLLSATAVEHTNSDRLGFEWFPRMDVVESGTAYVITIELPGVSADGIQVEVVRGSLIVTGSRSTDWWKANSNGSNGGGTVYHRRELAQGPYRTVWRLPKNGDINGITAEFIDGFLRILVPKIKVMAYL